MTRDEDYIGSVAYDCGFRAGQSHDAGLLAALEAAGDAMASALVYVSEHSAYDHVTEQLVVAGKAVDAAIAAAKGA